MNAKCELKENVRHTALRKCTENFFFCCKLLRENTSRLQAKDGGKLAHEHHRTRLRKMLSDLRQQCVQESESLPPQFNVRARCGPAAGGWVTAAAAPACTAARQVCRIPRRGRRVASSWSSKVGSVAA